MATDVGETDVYHSEVSKCVYVYVNVCLCVVAYVTMHWWMSFGNKFQVTIKQTIISERVPVTSSDTNANVKVREFSRNLLFMSRLSGDNKNS